MIVYFKEFNNAYIKRYWAFYAVACAVILGLKYYYSKAGVDELAWILAPTAWWAGALSGVGFVREPEIGYVSHLYRFVIAPPCSGVQFMLIVFAMLLFTFVHRMPTKRACVYWTAAGIVASYLCAVFVNGFRISLALYHNAPGRPIHPVAWLTPERLHTVEGVLIYFGSLFILYNVAGYAADKMGRIPGVLLAARPGANSCAKAVVCPGDKAAARHGALLAARPGANPGANLCAGSGSSTLGKTVRKSIVPLFWYCAVTLGIPAIHGLFSKGDGKFAGYVALVAIISAASCCVLGLALYIRGKLCKTR